MATAPNASQQVLDALLNRITYAQANAGGYTVLAEEASRQVMLAAASFPSSIQVPHFPTNIPPLPATPTLPLSEVVQFDDGLVAQTMDELKGIFAEFYAEHFPTQAYATAAQAWLTNQISVGGSGIRPAVENAIWARARARISRDVARQEEEAAALWASRGFDMPPGQLNADIQKIRADAAGQIAETSRVAAVKSFDAEQENTRFAIQQSIDLYTKAFQISVDYFRVFAQVLNQGNERTKILLDSKAALTSALIQIYKIKADHSELGIRIGEAQFGAETRAAEVSFQAQAQALRSKVDAATAVAQSAGQRAAASLNALGASLQANVNTQT